MRRLIAFAVREAASEAARIRAAEDSPGSSRAASEAAATARSDDPVKIDVVNFLRELATPQANEALQKFFVSNHRFVALLMEKNRRAAADTYDFIDANMTGAMYVHSQFRFIAAKSAEIMSSGGHILDLGVYKGGSTRELAKIFPNELIHGFDSFEGLPGDWTHALKGSFGDVKGILPKMPANVRLYKGWFEDTLPLWLEQFSDKSISLLRVDCDIYESTRTIFTVLERLIGPGTWIVFDELIGYSGFRNHELKAFEEFIAKTGFEYEYVAFGLTYAVCRLREPTSVFAPRTEGEKSPCLQ